MSTNSSKIILNFFGETVTISKPESLDALRESISKLFFFSPEDAKEILLTYNENGDRIMIENEEDLKSFLNSKITTIDLDISQTSQIYKKNMENIKQENEKDKLELESLLKRQEELDNIAEKEFAKDREEMGKIREQLMELRKKQHEIRIRIIQGKQKIHKEKIENNKKIAELQKKLGLPVTQPKKLHNKEKKHPHIKARHYHRMMPFGFPCFYPPMHHRIPQKQNINNKTFDNWGQFFIEKGNQLKNMLTEKFKDFNLFNDNPINENKEEKEKKEDKKEIHYFVQCDGCGMAPIFGKRFKCKACQNFDYCEKCMEKNKETHKHEFKNIPVFPRPPRHFHPMPYYFNRPEKLEKKLEKSKTMGNMFKGEDKKKEIKNEIKDEIKDEIKNENNNTNNLAEKLIHFGVTCDGCGVFPIVGCRYKCAVCNDFDFCEECEKKKGEEHNHPFLKISKPSMAPIDFKCFEN